MSRNFFEISSISPLDGRYATRVQGLATLFSEFALIKHRTQVEIEYLIAFLVEQHCLYLELKQSVFILVECFSFSKNNRLIKNNTIIISNFQIAD